MSETEIPLSNYIITWLLTGVRDLITHLLQVDARKRYTAIDVICHPFIVTCAGTFNPPNMEQLRYNLRNELNKDALVHRNSFAAVLAQLK